MDREIITRSKGKKGPVTDMDKNTDENTTDGIPLQQRQHSSDAIIHTPMSGACGGGDREEHPSDSEMSVMEEDEPRLVQVQLDAGDNIQRHNTEEKNLRKLLLEMKHEVSAEITGAIREALGSQRIQRGDNSINRDNIGGDINNMDNRIRGDNSEGHIQRQSRARARTYYTRYRDDSEDRRNRPLRNRRHENRRENLARSLSSDTEQDYTTYNTEDNFSPRRRNADQTAAKLPPFTGKEKWTVWINRFQEVARLKRWDDNKKLVEILPRLQGPAGEFVYGQLSHRIRTNFATLVKELNSRFRVVETSKTFGAQFSNRNQRAGELVEEYAADLKRLYDKAHANRDSRTRQEDLLRRFLDGLSDNKTRFHVEYVKEPADIDEAVYEVVNFQETRRMPAANDHGMERRNRRPARLVRPYSDSEDEDDEEEEQGDRVARAPPRPKKSQTIKNVPWKNREDDQAPDTQEKGDNSVNTDAANTEKSEIEKQNGNIQEITTVLKQLSDRIMKLETNHTSQQQYSQSSTIASGNGNNQQKINQGQVQGNQNRTGRKCYNCQEEGHFARECTKPKWGYQNYQEKGARQQPHSFNRNMQHYPQQMRPHQGN